MLRPLGMLSFSIIFSSVTALSQSSPDFRSRMLVLKRTIEQKHYSPVPVNDSFSVQVFDSFIERLNDEYEYLGAHELEKLQHFRNRIDDELNGNGWQFLDSVTKIYKAALTKAKADHPKSVRVLEHPAGFEHHVTAVFGDVIANQFDPHTEYMPREEKEEFESSLSTEGSYFGFALSKNAANQIEITRIMPGSPAWKTGELNAGDVIVSAGWEGKAPVNFKEGAEELLTVLSVPGNQKLTVTVRKANGMEKTTTLSRAKMENEENNVRAYVLKGTKNIGYIYLPDFYTTYAGNDGSSANDVAKAVVKLKKENIGGLVLDVRYNGGGSLAEALDMAGIFIDAGPLAMIREKNGKITSLKDQNRGTIYSGPMILLLNGQSASASELLAAVLQDYHRAIIAGSRTFGKGSAQQIFPVDTTGTQASQNPDFGFVKITTSKFYRVNGNTTQFNGVKPDIALPDIFEALDYHEGALPSALPADSVPANPYYKPLPSLPLEALAQKSNTRVTAHADYKGIVKQIKAIKSNNPESLPSVKISTPSKLYTVQINSFDAETVKGGDYHAEIDKRWNERISSDIYIEEAYNILNDLINLKP